MDNQVNVSYERWNQSGGYQEDLFESVSLDELIKLILSIADEHTATLCLVVNKNTMDVAVSKGLYSLGYQLSSKNKYFRLLADASTSATLDYVLGGQLVINYPTKYIVNVDDIVKQVSKFYMNGTINYNEDIWELYTPNTVIN